MRGAIESLGQHTELLCCPASILRLNGLIHARNHHGCIAGELAGGVDGVPVPWAIGQACLGDERGLSLAQGLVQLAQVALRIDLPVMRFLRGGDQVAGGQIGRSKIHRAQAGVRGFAFGGGDVTLDGFAVGHVVVRQHVGVGHAQGFKAEDARHLL